MEFFIALALISLVIGSFIFALWLSCKLIKFTKNYFGYFLKKDAPTLNRQTIKDIYRINPKRIVFERGYDWGVPRGYVGFIYSDYCEKIYFNVNFIDYIWLVWNYKAFIKKKNKKNITNNQKRSLEKIITLVQSDIDKLKAQADKEIKTAKEVTENVMKNM